jgi:phage terminase Nu1 subunit (DNA packaging protein)
MSSLPKQITTAQLLCITGFSRAYLVELENRGIIKKEKRGYWKFPESANLIIGHLRESNKRREGSPHAQVAKMRASEIEQRMLIRARRLVPMEMAEALVARWAGAVRSELGGVPARVSRDVQLRKAIEREINAALSRASTGFAASEDEMAEPNDGEDSDAVRLSR